jgi:hypothetical protein
MGLMALALLVVACGGEPKQEADTDATPNIDVSLVGTYNCSPGGGAPAEDVIELKEDGTLTITQGGTTIEGTWSAEGGRGAFKPEGQPEDPFTVEGDRLVFGGDSYCIKKA